MVYIMVYTIAILRGIYHSNDGIYHLSYHGTWYIHGMYHVIMHGMSHGIYLDSYRLLHPIAWQQRSEL
jgi:hypothetical protein